MKIDIDFSIFESHTRAFGNVTGVLDVASIPGIGALVPFIGRRGLITEDGFPGLAKVVCINSVEGAGRTFGLADAVMSSHASAARLARRLAEEMNLFVVEYHPR